MAVPAYPVRVEANLDPQLGRWLWLVKWFLTIPPFIVLALGLDGVPMTDDHPPFRPGMGGHEPGHILSAPGTHTPHGGQPGAGWEPPRQPASRHRWTGWRIASVVIGSLLFLTSLGLLAGGGLATWADNTQRDAAGYLTTGTHSFATTSYALTSDGIHLGSGADVFTPSAYLGTVRVRVTPVRPKQPVFVGIASQSAVDRYLNGVRHEVVTNWPEGRTTLHVKGGAPPAVPPAALRIWAAQSTGTGTQMLTWRPNLGSWTVVVMNADASAGLSVNADVGATVPDLGWIAAGLLTAGGVLLLIAGALIVVPVVRSRRS